MSNSLVSTQVPLADVAEVSSRWLDIGDLYLETLYLQGVEMEVHKEETPIEAFYQDAFDGINF